MMEITKGKIIDYLSYALAVILLIYTILSGIAATLTIEQQASLAFVLLTLSQFGSWLRIIIENLQRFNLTDTSNNTSYDDDQGA